MENYSDITPSTKTMLGWRERPPTSHSLKIKNFSEFEKSTLPNDGKYQSRLFSSGGYNWRMTIYPKGNDKDNGIGFISMYVEIDTTSPTSIIPSELLADLRFYVYNNKQKKYLTIQAGNWFNKAGTGWGFREFKSVDEIRKAYLDKYDNLNVEIEFEVVSETKYSLP